MDFNQRSSSRSSQIPESELSDYKTHFIMAQPSWEYLSSSYLYPKSLAEGLMDASSREVTLEIPLNTQMKIFAFLFKENYSHYQLFSAKRDVGYYGESQPFSIGTNTNSLSLRITLKAVSGNGGGSTGDGGGGEDHGDGDHGGSGDYGGTDTTAPTVTFSPVNGATGVAISDNIIITFSEAVRNIDNTVLTDSNIDSLITLKLTNASGANITFDATIDANMKVITINPISNLPNSQAVYVAIGATVEDSADHVITAANATFTTKALEQTTATAPSGSGTSGDPYLISNLAELSYISQNMGGTNYWASGVYLKQTANIDATATKYWDDADGNSDGDKYNDQDDMTDTGNDEGFSPIGNTYQGFSGTYDGAGFSINGLTIIRSNTDNIGLFGYTSVAKIRNLGLTCDNITGKEKIGSLVGFALFSSSIDNCSSSGTVTGTKLVGGLVGNTYTSTIRNSYSTATVNGGSGDNVGGLAGYISTNSTILNSYST